MVNRNSVKKGDTVWVARINGHVDRAEYIEGGMYHTHVVFYDGDSMVENELVFLTQKDAYDKLIERAYHEIDKCNQRVFQIKSRLLMLNELREMAK
ncbi:hypothetical protein N9137_00930 [Pseudomonadales bacterium]|nr:hypothetical protein [Pseudomonadales bacterium]